MDFMVSKISLKFQHLYAESKVTWTFDCCNLNYAQSLAFGQR